MIDDTMQSHTSAVQKLLGVNPTFDIFHPTYAVIPHSTNSSSSSSSSSFSSSASSSLPLLHVAPHPEAIFEDEEEQSFDEFVEIGRRKPNLKGTGRWTRTATRSKLALFYFGKKYSSSSSRRRGSNDSEIFKSSDGVIQRHAVLKLQQFLSVYFQLEVDLFEQFDAIDVNDQCFRLSGSEYDITRFDNKVVRKNKNKRGSNVRRVDQEHGARIDVFSLFDVLVHEAKEPYLSIVGLFDCALGEALDNRKSPEFIDVLGRACGDRVASVSLPFCDSLKSLLCNTAHELLHTIGFDHCNSYQCIMNAIGYEEWMFLSPINLRKLKCFHGKDNDNGVFIISRYEKLLELLSGFGNNFSEDCKWLQMKLDVLRQLSSSSREDNIHYIEVEVN